MRQMSLKHPGMHIWVRKNFLHYSRLTIMGIRSTILIVDFGYVVGPDQNFQKCTKWLIDSPKRLFGPEKKFVTMIA